MCSSIPKPKFPVAEKFLHISDVRCAEAMTGRLEVGEVDDRYLVDGSGRVNTVVKRTIDDDTS